MTLFNKILHITPYYPPNLGGVQKCAEVLANSFACRGYNVKVITSDLGSRITGKTQIGNLSVCRLKSLEIAHTSISFGLFGELLKIDKDSIVHLHISNAFFPEAVYFMSILKRFKYVAHFHIDVEASGKAGFLLPIYKSLILSRVLKCASGVICLTDSFKKLLIDKYSLDEEKIMIVPNGAEENFYVGEREVRKNGPYKILYVGRLAKQKNLNRLLNAFALLGDGYLLDIVGSGEEEIELVRLVKTLNLNNVFFYGRKEGNELVVFYQQADLFVMPSSNEGMSLAILEAMAAGVPILTSDMTQNREYIGKGGVYVDETDVQSIKKGILEVMRNREKRVEMSDLNKKNSRQYGWKKSADLVESLYRSIWNY